MKIQLTKIRAMIKFFANNTDPEKLGKVKLMKLFYFADFNHVREHGKPITFDDYIKLEHGPIPTVIKNLVDEVDEDPEVSVLADIIEIERVDGRYLCKIISKEEFKKDDENLFSVKEMDTLKETCRRFYSCNTKNIEIESHEDGPWSKVGFLDPIPYSLVFDGDDEESQTKREMVEFIVNLSN